MVRLLQGPANEVNSASVVGTAYVRIQYHTCIYRRTLFVCTYVCMFVRMFVQGGCLRMEESHVTKAHVISHGDNYIGK